MAKRFEFRVINGPASGSDPLGGPVSKGNAALTMLSVWIDGPSLDALAIGESQIRQAATADGRVRVQSRGKVTYEAIRYRVTRLEDGPAPEHDATQEDDDT